MASYNRIILAGNVTRDPELTYTPGNVAVCKFGIATNHKWKDKDGNSREDVCFVECDVFGRAGETFNQYMAKGRSVLIEGRLQLNQWTTPAGEKKSRHQVLVENFTFLGNKQDSQQPAPKAAPVTRPADYAKPLETPWVDDTDIKF